MILAFKYQVMVEYNGEHCVYDTFDSRGKAEQAMQELKDDATENNQPAFDIWITETKEQQT